MKWYEYYIYIISYIHICAILSIMAFESNWNPSHIPLKVDIHLIIINILICYLQWHFLRAGDEIAMRDLYIPPLGLIGCATWTKPKPFSGRVFQGETVRHNRHSRHRVADVDKYRGTRCVETRCVWRIPRRSSLMDEIRSELPCNGLQAGRNLVTCDGKSNRHDTRTRTISYLYLQWGL